MQITSSQTITEAIITEQFLASGVFWMGGQPAALCSPAQLHSASGTETLELWFRV